MPSSLLFSLPACLVFWSAVWAAPMRTAFGTSFADPLLVSLPNWPVLRRLGPLCVQRLIARALVARLAWMREHHIPVLPRFERDSEICWDDVMTQPADRECLRDSSEWDLDYFFGMYTEWLTHILDMPPEAVDPLRRLVAIVGICGRLAQIYAEWRRRVGAAEARALVRECLRHYLGPQALAS